MMQIDARSDICKHFSSTSVTIIHVVACCRGLYGVVASGFHETTLFRRGISAPKWNL